MGTSAISQILVTTDEQVKASATDPAAGLLDAKVDATTINVVSEQLVRADLTGDVTTYTPSFFHGKTNTVSLGMNFGF